jgi:hypothetical protein
MGLEFDALSPEDQTSWCYFTARSAAASGAKIAADRAAFVADYFTGKDAEDQLKRFTNVQPQAESVKDEVELAAGQARPLPRIGLLHHLRREANCA